MATDPTALPYVGPYSPAAYNAAAINADGGQATPYNSNIINAGYAIGNAISGSDVNGASITPEQQAAARAKADAIQFLTDNGTDLQGLLGRLDTARQNGLTQNQDQYDKQLGLSQIDKDNQVVKQTKAGESAQNSIRQNANAGLRSLQQIIGRASGTGSSAFRDLLPHVVGTDTSSKTRNATETYGTNLSNIDNSFASVLADLAEQKKRNEEALLTGIEQQRQGIQSQIGQNQSQLAAARGGDYASQRAAGADARNAINNSRNLVESFATTYRTPYTAPVLDPKLTEYTTDRASINAQGQPGVDSTNPYASLLRKKLQGA